MDIRYAAHPEQMKTLDTQKMRGQFLVEVLPAITCYILALKCPKIP